MDISLMPDIAMLSVRGMGVAEIVRQSTAGNALELFLLLNAEALLSSIIKAPNL